MREILERLRRYMSPPRVAQPQGLISVLLDKTLDPDNDRDDAAMDLGAYDEPEALTALIQVASDPTEPHDLLEQCADSIYAIWRRRGGADQAMVARLAPPAREYLARTPTGSKQG